MARLGALLVAGFGSAFAAPWQGAAKDGWERVEPGLELEFPRDHGPHPRHRTEWWYLTGHLEDEDGGRFGFQLTIFRSGLGARVEEPKGSALRAREAFAGHLAITEVAAKRVRFAERLRRGSSSLVRARAGVLDLELEDWSLALSPEGILSLSASDRAQGMALALELRPEKPLVLHGAGGVSQKGPEPGNASAYVSWTRLAAEGELGLDGASRRVRGEAWFDHEWGTSQLGAGVAGWDWFAVQLADGRELMLYSLRREDGRPSPFSAGTLVEADGRARPLALRDFRIEPAGTWRSPRSGARYPARWRIAVPAAELELTLEPLVPDSELDARRSSGVIYWEGPVSVTGSARGRGYAELTGYATSLAGRF